MKWKVITAKKRVEAVDQDKTDGKQSKKESTTGANKHTKDSNELTVAE